MKITDVTEQKRNKDRLNVFVDGRFSFGVHPEVWLDFGLKVGREISEEIVNQVKAADDFRQAFDRALNFLSSRPRSRREVEQYLRDKLIYKNSDYAELESSEEKEKYRAEKAESIERILDRLAEKKYLDDAAFAKWWIDNRRQFRPRGKRLLLLELKAKGVSDADIEAALTTPDEEGHFSSEAAKRPASSVQHPEMDAHSFSVSDEVALAVRVAEKYGKKYMELDEWEFKQKVGRHLASKGFDWEVVEEAIKQVRGSFE